MRPRRPSTTSSPISRAWGSGAYLAAWQAAIAGIEMITQPYRHGAELAQQMATMPVLILACIEHGTTGTRPGPITRGASIYPAVQNLLLAARALGLGTVLTTLHTQYEHEIKALLRIPATVETAALIPVGYPAEGARWGRARRRPLSEVVFHERWGERQPHEGRGTAHGQASQ
jgi:nitroreductase